MNNIERIRKEKGFSRAGLSRAAEVPIRSLEDYEFSRRALVHPNIIKLAKTLGVTIDELVGFKLDEE